MNKIIKKISVAFLAAFAVLGVTALVPGHDANAADSNKCYSITWSVNRNNTAEESQADWGYVICADVDSKGVITKHVTVKENPNNANIPGDSKAIIPSITVDDKKNTGAALKATGKNSGKEQVAGPEAYTLKKTTLSSLVGNFHSKLSSKFGSITNGNIATTYDCDHLAGSEAYAECLSGSNGLQAGVKNQDKATLQSLVEGVKTDMHGYDASAEQDNPDTTNYSTSGGADSSDQHPCYANAGPLGWIVCPVTDKAFEVLNDVYLWVEQNFLKIDVQALFDEDNGVLKAWEAFRDIANIVFIVLFIVVILSQLTGFGIDNYGIKKILPKLIVVAILINLSYILCQVAVDVANIVGVSLREFLSGLVTPAYSKTTPDSGVEGWIFLGVSGGATLAIGTALAGPGLIIAILAAAITGAIAVLFLWVILVIRQAGIVVLIAIAPLAIACYLLPNTDKLFKRWLDIFKALLLLYPLASLVIGAGTLAGNILGSIDADAMRLAAMIVQVVPFFFIPMLLRKSLDGMGNLGARISNFGRTQGRNLGGRARQGLNNTNFAQLRREDAARRRMGLLNTLPSSQRVRARRQGTINALDEREKKDLRTLWRDENGNFDLNRVQAAYRRADASGDTVARQAALEAWGEVHSASLAEEISKGNISQQGIDYIKSNGTLRKAVSTDNVAVKQYLKDLDGGFAGTYETWARPGFDENGQAFNRELNAIQNASAQELAAQDHSVFAAQARDDRLSAEQQQQLADNPNLVSSLQGDVRSALNNLTQPDGSQGLPQSTQSQNQAQATSAAQTQAHAMQALHHTTHQQYAATQMANNPTILFQAPSGWQKDHQVGHLYHDPNNPGVTYNAKNNTFNLPHN